MKNGGIFMNNQDLALTLATIEKEEEVVRVLKECGYWDDYEYWLPFGDNENNYSIIGNQQSSADAAFMEKIINSIDAVLMKSVMAQGIDITSPQAPQSMTDAVDQFFGIKNGQLCTLSAEKRTEIAENNIIVAATGQKSGEMNLSIIDRGEGQTPNCMPETILSISRSNKLKVPFVQGKFNMGGTGALPFCGKHRLQLIISKRCPDIPNSNLDDSYDKWSVTVVRSEDAREGRKSSMYTYLTDKNGHLLTFKATSLKVIPKCYDKNHPGKFYENMEYGTLIKLYNYQLTGYKTSIILDFYNRLNLLIPNLALPIRLRECREYNAHTNETTAPGLVTRLYDDRSKIVENSFPTSSTFSVDGQEVKCSVYLFKKDDDGSSKGSKMKKNEGVLFMVNGQTQGILPNNFFTSVNLSYIKDSVLVIVDCSALDIPHQEKLFMTSRDRIRNDDFAKELINRIKDHVRNHAELKNADYKRRTEALKNKLADNKPLKDVLQDILKKNTVLSKIFLQGTAIRVPFNTANAVGDGTREIFKGKKHPTFFRLLGKMKDNKVIKKIPVNHNFRVQFETDVENDYFYRPTEAGKLLLKMDGVVREDMKLSCNLLNGTCTLTVMMPQGATVGEMHVFETSIEDDCIVDNFTNTFVLIVDKAEPDNSGGDGGRRKPSDPKQKGNRQKTNGIALPQLIPVKKEEWDRYGMDEYTALVYVPTNEGGDYYLNMENLYLKFEVGGIHDMNRVDLIKAKYTYSMALIGMSIISYYKNLGENDTEVDIPAKVKTITTMLAPIVLPLLETMNDLNIKLAETAA